MIYIMWSAVLSCDKSLLTTVLFLFKNIKSYRRLDELISLVMSHKQK